jgi:hypothetical protein
MAITSISRLQQRRGIKTDLPDNLYEGEFGWCLDTRELFIGNGKTYTGNSQVLTQYGPNTALITHAYVGNADVPANTGSDLDHPVLRSIGSKFDDWANVKDYGAAGNGVTDDTAAIQRAIADRWNMISQSPYSILMGMSKIYFPAGTYVISSAIKIYPWVALVGDGPQRSAIVMSANAADPCVLRTADSLGQVDVNIGLNNAVLPSDLLIEGLRIDNSANPTKDGVRIQRATKVILNDLCIIGGWQNTTGNLTATVGLKLDTLSTLYQGDRITVRDTEISGFVSGIYSSDPIRYTVVDACDINSCYQGVVLYNNVNLNGPSYFRVVNSQFRNIDNHGLDIGTTRPGITSANNVYDQVGVWDTVAPIHFDVASATCSSINDTFTPQSSSLIDIGNSTNLFISAQQYAPFGPVTLLDNQGSAVSTGITYNTSVYNMIRLEYSITKGTYTRMGSIHLVSNGTVVTINDTGYNAGGSPGITFSATISSGVVTLKYTSTSTGSAGTLRYRETDKWLA